MWFGAKSELVLRGNPPFLRFWPIFSKKIGTSESSGLLSYKKKRRSLIGCARIRSLLLRSGYYCRVLSTLGVLFAVGFLIGATLQPNCNGNPSLPLPLAGPKDTSTSAPAGKFERGLGGNSAAAVAAIAGRGRTRTTRRTRTRTRRTRTKQRRGRGCGERPEGTCGGLQWRLPAVPKKKWEKKRRRRGGGGREEGGDVWNRLVLFQQPLIKETQKNPQLVDRGMFHKSKLCCVVLC